jgi:hypothetical protein
VDGETKQEAAHHQQTLDMKMCCYVEAGFRLFLIEHQSFIIFGDIRAYEKDSSRVSFLQGSGVTQVDSRREQFQVELEQNKKFQFIY